MLLNIQLIPFHPKLYEDEDAINILTQWRNSALHTFADPTPVTPDSTRNWLKIILKDPNKHLWFVKERSVFAPVIGHIGIVFNNSTTELGYVLRGVPKVSPGAMSAAVLDLLFHNRELILKVLTTNTHAIQFYEALGFKQITKEPPFIVMHATYDKA